MPTTLDPPAAASGGTASQLAYLTRVLRAPALRESIDRLADAAREQGWTHEEFLAAVLGKEVAAREAHGATNRIRTAGLAAGKTLEDFDFAHAPALNRELVVHLAMGDYILEHANVLLLGPPGTGKTHLATALGIRAAHGGHKVAFATASHWVMRLARAHNAGTLETELRRLARIPLLIIDLCRPRDYAEGSVGSVLERGSGAGGLGIVSGGGRPSWEAERFSQEVTDGNHASQVWGADG